MGKTLMYPRDEKNTVHRKADRGRYDLMTIHTIVNSISVLHVSFHSLDPADPFPQVLPMIGTMGSYAHPSASLNEPLECYLHGYVSSGIMKRARADPKAGIPLTIAATKVDGIVLSLTPNSHSYNYRSAILFGYGRLVEDPEEKLWAMELVTNSVLQGRWDHTRTPPDAGEMASTTILKVKIVKASGKIRAGGPGDDKKDTERQDIVDRVWTGVVPVFECLGIPVKGGNGLVANVPDHVQDFRIGKNRENEEYACAAARKEVPGG